ETSYAQSSPSEISNLKSERPAPPAPDPRPPTPDSAPDPPPRTPKPRAPHILTSARLEACYRGITAARAVTRLYDAPNYGNHFFHGLTCLDLRRSAPLCGESRDEFDRFLARLSRRLAPDESPRPVAVKLARSAALVSWRRLRAFGAQASWEMRRVQFLLGEVILERERSAGPLPAGRLASLGEELVGGLGLLGHGRRLEESGVLERRLERLLRMRLREKNGGADPHFHYLARVSRFEQAAPLDEREEWLSNPLAGRQAIERSCEASELAVRPTEDWGRHTGGDARWLTDGWMSERERFLRYTLPGLTRRAKMPELRATNAGDFEAFCRLVEQAFGEEPGFGIGDSEFATKDSSFPNPEPRNPSPGLDSSFPNPESRTPNPVRSLAVALWERLQIFARRAEQEAAALDKILGESRTPNPETRDLQTLAAKILSVFCDGCKTFDAAEAALERVKGALRELLQSRYGPRPEFDDLKPEPPDTLREAHELVGQLIDWEVRQAMARRGVANLVEWNDALAREREARKRKRETRRENREAGSRQPEVNQASGSEAESRRPAESRSSDADSAIEREK
ncbi:MAG TPA: hypothetical protein VGW33_06130, partial [Terriglobia bacterium]|nr:hypothetical protein [Terriglobia bacterium]